MKLLLDQNLSRRLLPHLQSHFPGTTQVALVGLERAFLAGSDPVLELDAVA